MTSNRFTTIDLTEGETIREFATGTFRITVERVDPGKTWWCVWSNDTGYDAFHADKEPDASEFGVTFRGGEVVMASGYIRSATKPTLEQFADAVKEGTPVDLPIEREEAQWHVWARESEAWVDDPHVYGGVFVNNTSIEVYGTTADRDAKRDALLEAAKAAGKGGDA